MNANLEKQLRDTKARVDVQRLAAALCCAQSAFALLAKHVLSRVEDDALRARAVSICKSLMRVVDTLAVDCADARGVARTDIMAEVARVNSIVEAEAIVRTVVARRG